MKFQPTWQQVTLLAVLLTAIIVAHLFAPLAVSAVTSIVSTIVGALFVNLKSGPVFTVAKGGLIPAP
jgi:hypothetical protein